MPSLYYARVDVRTLHDAFDAVLRADRWSPIPVGAERPARSVTIAALELPYAGVMVNATHPEVLSMLGGEVSLRVGVRVDALEYDVRTRTEHWLDSWQNGVATWDGFEDVALCEFFTEEKDPFAHGVRDIVTYAPASAELGLSEQIVREAHAFFEDVLRALERGEKVRIKDFGNFSVREGYFRASHSFKEALGGGSVPRYAELPPHVAQFLRATVEQLRNGYDVVLCDDMVLVPVKYHAYAGRNPATGASVPVPKKVVLPRAIIRGAAERMPMRALADDDAQDS